MFLTLRSGDIVAPGTRSRSRQINSMHDATRVIFPDRCCCANVYIAAARYSIFIVRISHSESEMGGELNQDTSFSHLSALRLTCRICGVQVLRTALIP